MGKKVIPKKKKETLNNSKVKELLLNECKRILKETIDVANETVKEAQEDAHEYQTNDVFDGYRTQMLNKRDLFAEQLHKAMDEYTVLEKIDSKRKSSEVEFGAVVITDKQRLFISVGVGKVKLDEELYFAISPKVPVYDALKGKKKGDTFVFNGIKGTIKEII